MATSDNAGRSTARTKKKHAFRSGAAPLASSPAVVPNVTDRSRAELSVLTALCLLGAIRIFFGCLALPFFADTDEGVHFDLVHKFARGYWPVKHHEFRDADTVELTILDSSPEFIARLSEYPQHKVPPPIRDWPTGETKYQTVAQLRALLNSQPNHEAHSPPVYYAVAGVWYDIGKFLGLAEANRVYWVRLLNAPIYAGIVVISYWFTRPYFGGKIALAVAALTAFFPDTVFFTINSDIFSPLFGTLTLVLALRWYEAEQPSPWLGASVGGMAAAGVLSKLTNIAVFAGVGALVLLRSRIRRSQPIRCTIRETWPLVLAAALPILLWIARNELVLKDAKGAGDAMGTASKMELLTWKLKPYRELLNHPIFQPSQLGLFLARLTSNLFDGDANWHNEPARSRTADTFFLVTSATCPWIGLGFALARGSREPKARFGAMLSAWTVMAFLAVLIALSMRFDYGECKFPSREFPFFTSGRLIAGGLVPFLALYAYGLRALFGERPIGVAAAVAVTVFMMVLAQEPFLRAAMESKYNWFHRPSQYNWFHLH